MATQANAQDGFNWTGAYVGGHLGYGWGQMTDVLHAAATPKKPDGILGGVQLGYDYQFNNRIVLGAVADISASGVGETWDGDNQYDPYYTEDKFSSFGTLRARLGYAADRFLPYITGGLFWANTNAMLGCSPAHAPGGTTGCKAPFETSDSQTNLGWAVGGGVEYAVTDKWTVGLEYLHGEIGNDYNVALVDPNYPNVRRAYDTDLNVVRLNLNFRF